VTTQVSRKAAGLPVNVEKRLLSYALVAGAGIVAGSQPANAAIIYVDIPNVVLGPTDSYVLNIGGSGGGSFIFDNNAFTSSGSLYGQAVVFGAQTGDAIVTAGGYYPFAFYMSTSMYVGGSWSFEGTALLGAYEEFYGGLVGSFPGVGPKMVGVKFIDGLNTYYGWIRVSVTFTPGVGFTTDIYDYAYNTTPGQAFHIFPIPEPGTLGLLALGATGLVLSRLRKRQR